jgi:hypothetical protein
MQEIWLTVEQVYFIWVIRDFGSAEWFHSLLQAIEEQPGTEGRIEIHIYLTAKLKVEDMHNIMVRGLQPVSKLNTHNSPGGRRRCGEGRSDKTACPDPLWSSEVGLLVPGNR